MKLGRMGGVGDAVCVGEPRSGHNIFKGRGDHFRGLVINRRITLKWMLKKEMFGLSILFHKRQGVS
jgi:hypothetical protein